MRPVLLCLAVAFGVTGCAQLPARVAAPEPGTDTAATSTEVRPVARPAGRAPPAGARTVEAFDTTTDAERAAAVTEAETGGVGRALGRTIASLGDPGEPGIWMKTPLVASPAKGRVAYPAKGTSVAVDLIPIEGEPGAGSRLSLAAMRLLEADLTALPEVEVYLVSN